MTNVTPEMPTGTIENSEQYRCACARISELDGAADDTPARLEQAALLAAVRDYEMRLGDTREAVDDLSFR